MTDKNPLAHYSGVLSEAVQESAAVPDQAQIKALMRKHRIWIEHSTLFEDDEPPRELRAVQAEQHQFEAFVKDLITLGTAPAAQVADFQQRVQPWMMACFGPEISADRIERNHRFLEESLELVQSLGCTASEAHQLVDYVFGRPVGEPAQEAGGVMVTFAALCLASGLDMHACGETELARIWTKVEAIRAKQAAKPKHSPLPMHAPQAQAAASIYVTADGQRECDDWKVPLPIGRNLLYTAPQAQADARDALAWLEEFTCDLRCVSTSEDDYAWNVIEHHMAEPRERVIGWGQTAIAAVRDAQAAAQSKG